METIRLYRTRKGHPALWEQGGGATNTGYSQIITNEDGTPKRPVYIRSRGSLSQGEHALFIVNIGDIIIKTDHHRKDFNIYIYKITSIREEEAELQLLHEYSEGEWDVEPPPNLLPAITAAKDKATCYHCREPHYYRQG